MDRMGDAEVAIDVDAIKGKKTSCRSPSPHVAFYGGLIEC